MKKISKFFDIREIKLIIAIMFSVEALWFYLKSSYMSIFFFILAIIYWISCFNAIKEEEEDEMKTELKAKKPQCDLCYKNEADFEYKHKEGYRSIRLCRSCIKWLKEKL